MQPSRVDFPAPFGPMRQVSEPVAMSSETSSTALTAPNAFVTPDELAGELLARSRLRAGADAAAT